MTLTERLAELVRAAFPGIWVVSREHDEALEEIDALCRREGWSLAAWDLDRGLRPAAGPGAAPEAAAADPLAALRALAAMAAPGGTAVLVLRNLHRLLGSAELAQALDTRLGLGKRERTFVVVLAPHAQVPPELGPLFVVVEHERPGRDELAAIARGVATEPGELPGGEGLEAVLEAAAGLTRAQAENAFSLALVRHGRLEPDVLWELKARALRDSGLLSLHRGGEGFADLGGLGPLKAFCARALRRGGHPTARPRGVLLLGVPGTGKSAFCRALGREAGRPTAILDVGALYGSLVGQTEQRVREALRAIEALGPCVVMVDEVEKALAGAGGGAGDSGVGARLLGTLLSFLADREGDSFWVVTANDASRLPPELTRAERLDGLFFLDLPDRAAREAIWRQYRAHYGLGEAGPTPADRDWTGAEIRSCCRLAALLGVGLEEAADHVVPVAVTAGESVERLRSWAAGRCLSADRPRLYTRESPAARPGRPARRDPSAN